MTANQSQIEQRLIELLDEKNHYLANFVELNDVELLNFDDGYFENVETFYQSREKILDIIRCIDALIDDEVRALGEGVDELAVTGEVRSNIEDLIRSKDRLARQILAQDLKILEAIETEKSKIIRDLQQTSQSKKAVSAYSSGSVAENARQLDEKA